MATPADLAQTVKEVEALDRRILVFGEARYVTGVALRVDAGYTNKR
jgi:hypothetical protein